MLLAMMISSTMTRESGLGSKPEPPKIPYKQRVTATIQPVVAGKNEVVGRYGRRLLLNGLA